ncbi:MAG: competence/damage-inducible protein A [Archaeoglobi archaeon]|nr:competence/damage-inducible protein A [Candidatus Mnemosynella bozhongmuii]
MRVALITVGDEILSGDIENTNATWIARKLKELGSSLIKISVVPDDVEMIAEEIRSIEADYIIVTGGLGTTPDDVTREGVAKALNLEMRLNQEALECMKKYIEKYGLSEQIKKMATLPEGSKVICNRVGAAPGFIVQNIVVLPGVPKEMTSMFEEISELFRGEREITREVVTTAREMRITELLEELTRTFQDVKIGSYPKENSVKIKITGRDEKRVQEVCNILRERLKEYEMS